MKEPSSVPSGAPSALELDVAPPRRVLDALQVVLVDLVELHLQAKQLHWNVVGPGFRGLHLQLDDLVDVARQGADDVAERMRALEATPDGRIGTVAATTTLPGLPWGKIASEDAAELGAARIAAVSTTISSRRADVDGDDPASGDLLHQLVLALEKQAWMLRAEIDG